MGTICSTIVNALILVNSDPKKLKSIKWYQPSDFVPDYTESETEEEEPKTQTVEQMKEVLKAIAGVKG
jgi:hypothetical protein